MCNPRRTLPAVIALAALVSATNAQEAAFLGVQRGADHLGPGVLVDEVVEGSAALRSGFMAGDVIDELDGQAVVEFERLADSIRSKPVGTAVVVGVVRAGLRRHVLSVLGDRNLPGVAPTPLPDPLLAAFRRLAWKVESDYLDRKAPELPLLEDGWRRAREEHLERALAGLAEGDRASFTEILDALELRVGWFATHAARGVWAPVNSIVPGNDAAERAELDRQIGAAIRELDDPEYTVREAASEKLHRLGNDARAELEKTARGNSIEARLRARAILDQLDQKVEDADRPREERVPVEAEVLAFAGTAGRLAVRFGEIEGAPRRVRALHVRDEIAVGEVALELAADGAFETPVEIPAAIQPRDRLLWIDSIEVDAPR